MQDREKVSIHLAFSNHSKVVSRSIETDSCELGECSETVVCLTDNHGWSGAQICNRYVVAHFRSVVTAYIAAS